MTGRPITFNYGARSSFEAEVQPILLVAVLFTQKGGLSTTNVARLPARNIEQGDRHAGSEHPSDYHWVGVTAGYDR